MTIYFDFAMIDKLIYEAFPLSSQNKKNEQVKKYASIIIQNIVSLSLYEHNYKRARKYLGIANYKSNSFEKDDYYFWLNIRYLQDLVKYLEDKDLQAGVRVYSYIETIKNMGDEIQANAMIAEVNELSSRTIDLKTDDFDMKIVK